MRSFGRRGYRCYYVSFLAVGFVCPVACFCSLIYCRHERRGTVECSEKTQKTKVKNSNLVTAALLSPSAHLMHHPEGTQYDLYGVAGTGSLVRVGGCTVRPRSIISSHSPNFRARAARLQSFVTSPGSNPLNSRLSLSGWLSAVPSFSPRESCGFRSDAPVYAMVRPRFLTITSSVLLSVFLYYLPTYKCLSFPHLVSGIVRSTFAMVDTLFAALLDPQLLYPSNNNRSVADWIDASCTILLLQSLLVLDSYWYA